MKSLRSIFFWPLMLAITTAVGLIAALVSDGLGDAIGAVCLAVVVLTGMRVLLWPSDPRD